MLEDARAAASSDSCSTSSRPHSSKQVSNCKSALRLQNEANLFEKLSTEKGVAFTILRMNTLQPHEKNAVVAVCLDSQASMLLKYCMPGPSEVVGGPGKFSPLYLDIMFNVGQYYLLTTALQIPFLRRKNNPSTELLPEPSQGYGRGKVLLLGPTVIVTGKTAAEYSTAMYLLTSCLLACGTKKSTADWKPTVVTDHEPALQTAVKNAWPASKLLLCYMHMKKSIERVLEDKFLCSEKTIAVILRDIFGECSPSTNTFKSGLVDCEKTEDFEAALADKRDVWEALVKPFYDWFVAEKQFVFVAFINRSARAAAGIGKDLITNNVSESSNSMWRKLFPSGEKNIPLSEIITRIKKRIRQQERDMAETFHGNGPF